MKIPTVQTLQRINGIDDRKAKELRALLERYRDTYGTHYGLPAHVVLCTANDIVGGFGVEQIGRGHNQKSPAIAYVNLGDTYATTLMHVNGLFAVGDWGSIVERGKYD
jgi:hypothetical protein